MDSYDKTAVIGAINGLRCSYYAVSHQCLRLHVGADPLLGGGRKCVEQKKHGENTVLPNHLCKKLLDNVCPHPPTRVVAIWCYIVIQHTEQEHNSIDNINNTEAVTGYDVEDNSER